MSAYSGSALSIRLYDGESHETVRLAHTLGNDRIPKHDIGSLETLSALALIGLQPPRGSLHQCGIKPHFSRSRDRLPNLVVPPDHQQLLAWGHPIEAFRDIAQAAIAYTKAIDDGEAKRS